jgi:hypothetical protein
MNSNKIDKHFRHWITELIPILNLGNGKAIFVTIQAFKEAFDEPAKTVFNLKTYYVHSDLNVIFHEYLLKYLNLRNYMLKFLVRMYQNVVEYYNTDNLPIPKNNNIRSVNIQ